MTDNYPGSGLDKAPDKTLTEKLADTAKAVIKPFVGDKNQAGADSAKPPRTK